MTGDTVVVLLLAPGCAAINGNAFGGGGGWIAWVTWDLLVAVLLSAVQRLIPKRRLDLGAGNT